MPREKARAFLSRRKQAFFSCTPPARVCVFLTEGGKGREMLLFKKFILPLAALVTCAFGQAPNITTRIAMRDGVQLLTLINFPPGWLPNSTTRFTTVLDRSP